MVRGVMAMTREADWGQSIPPDEQERLRADAEYIVARLTGYAAHPPPHWTAAQVAAFARILANEQAKSAMLNWVLEGFRLRYGPQGEEADR